MLALRGFESNLAPERCLDSCAPAGVARPRLIPGIGAAATPARFERKPGAARHRLEAVTGCHVLFLLLRLFQRGKPRLLLARTLFTLVQPAGRGPNLLSTTWTEEMGDGRLLCIQLPVCFPAVASEDMALVVERIELRQQML